MQLDEYEYCIPFTPQNCPILFIDINFIDKDISVVHFLQNDTDF